MKPNPCETCGACCAMYPVSFPEEEITENSGLVPSDLTLSQKLSQRIMKGTQTANPRCIALQGCIGTRVRCSIYLDRPSACRNFIRSWEAGTGNYLCDRARSIYGLQPFSLY
ncbi:YkgJ family cysteine cluster protein [Desulfospira joergensenii]|uniref:YkgJ family cysteine cluster protein n=1 Tax=Desulfospira joergensenii TaxID=53329 RepID=UPI0003B773B3|nr:YkgJ family cysteine cluster protein [Desulfospira joergensenii]